MDRDRGWNVKNSAYWNTVILNVSTQLKLHLVTPAQISGGYSRVRQHTRDFVAGFEVDPTILA